MKVMVIFLLIILMAVSVKANTLTVDAKHSFTPSSDITINDDNSTNVIVYNGLRNVKENGSWVRIEDSKSLMDIIDYSINLDPLYQFTLNDFNYSKVDICISTFYKGIPIPLKIYSFESIDMEKYFFANQEEVLKCMEENNNDSSLCFPQYREIIHFQTNVTIPLFSIEPINQYCTVLGLKSIYGKFIKWGINSTTVIFNSTSGDGHVGYGQLFGTWNQVHNSLTGTNVNYVAGVAMVKISNWEGWGYDIYRTFFPINTSPLPDNAAIQNATFNFFVNASGVNTKYGIVQTTQDFPNNLSIADYDQCGTTHNPSQGAPFIYISNINKGWKQFVLNATGRSWIQPTGWTYLGIRQGNNDILDVPFASTVETYILTNENISHQPFLNITYTLDLEAPIITILNPSNNTINSTSNNLYFYYNVTDESDISNCSLIIDDAINATVISPSKDSTNSIQGNLSYGDYLWSINCTDDATYQNESETWNISVQYNPPPNVTLILPTHINTSLNFSNVIFNCSLTDSDGLDNVTLYTDYNGTWIPIETKSVSGKNTSVTFTRDIYSDLGISTSGYVDKGFKWNCLAWDNFTLSPSSSFSDSNYSASNWDLNSSTGLAIITSTNLSFTPEFCVNGDTDNGDGTCTGQYFVGNGDGDIYETRLKILGQCTGSLWLGARNVDSGDGVESGVFARVYVNNEVTVGEACVAYIYRSFFPVNISLVGDNIVILNASFHVYVSRVTNASMFRLVKTFQNNPQSLVFSDYNDVGYIGEEGRGESNETDPIAGADDLNITGTGWWNYTLNATGIGWLNKTSWTTIGIREQTYDGANVEPPQGDTIDAWIEINTSNADGTTYDPYLNITYRYIPSSNYTSKQFSNGSQVSWDNISWYNITLLGSNITIQTRTTNTAGCSGGWSAWGSFLNNPSGLINSSALCLEYLATFTSNETITTSTLMELNISYSGIVGTVDTCNPTSPLSANYIFQCSDNCIQNTNLNANGYNITITGAGTYTINANITNVSIMTIEKGCKVDKLDGV